MAEKRKSINLSFGDYEQKGLYLHFQDSSNLVLTRESIDKTAAKFWQDPAKIPPLVKEAGEFQRCLVCPLSGKGGLCDAIRPVLPFLNYVDKYVSFDKVTAIYKGEQKEVLHISDTTMQRALRYVSILSLMYYCQNGRRYWKYFVGVMPLAGGKEIASRVYLNMHWVHEGKKEEVDKVISKFNAEIRITSQNQVKRLNMICKNDVFMNAFVSTQIASQFLSMDMDKMLTESLANSEKDI